MVVSFKVSKTGTRPKPKPKPDPVADEEEDVGAHPPIHNNQFAKAKAKPSVDVTENGRDDSEISDADISFFINLFPDGYSIGNPSENRIVVQDDPKFLHPYDRTSESLFLAIERGLLPADFLDDIPCKYNNGAVACEVRDYRNSASEPGVNNGSSADSSRPITTKIRLKMSLENVVKDIPLISDSSWTYGDLMEAEARILIALNPKMDINPTPNLDRLCRPPTCTNLNLNIRELRWKRLRQMAGPDNSVNGKKICIDRVPENQNSALMVQPSDFVNSTAQNVVPASPSLSYQSKYQIGSGNPRVMQDHGSGPVQDMMNSYPESMNSNLGKRENQDSQLSSMTGLTKRARSNSMGLDGSPQQMDGLNSLMQQQQPQHSQQHQQSIGRGIQLPYNAGMQKYPFEGSFNQEQLTMGQPGLRYNLKQEPVDPELNRNMQMVDSDVDPRLQQQRLNQQFQRSSFPPTPWNTLDNSRKEEQFQRRKSAQSPRVSSGTLPQSPLSSKSGEFSSGSHGAQYAPQRDKSAVTSVPTVGGAGSLTSYAQMAARRSTSLPKTPAAMSGVGSPASVSNISGPGPFNASSPLVGKEADKSIRDKFSKIEMLTARYQLNMKKNKVDEYIENTSFSTQQLNHHLFNDLNNENPKDEDMPLSKSLVGGSVNVCKTRVLIFEQKERVLQGNGFSVSKSRTRLILSEKRDDGTVAMHYGELDDCDYLASEECLPTLPNTHIADLLAAQFQTLMLREGYELADDHLQPKPTNTVRSSGDQPNNNPSGVLSPKIEMSDTVSGHEIAKPSDSGNNNNNNASVNSSASRMHPPANSQLMQISQGGSGLLPPTRPMQPESQPSFQQNQHNLIQQQLQRSPAMMLASNPLSHLNAMGQNSNMQQLGHMLNKTTPLQLQMLQQQQQQQQQPQMQRKMMMGLGNVGMGGNTGNNMVGLQGMGNNIVGLQGMGANRGISPPMTGVLSGMGNNMGQTSINMNQASNFSNVISQQLRNGVITPVQAQMMNAKLRMVQQNRAMMGGAGGQSGNITGLPGANRQMHPGSSNYSMLGPGMNRANNVNPMQRTAMAPPKLMSGMNAYMNQPQQLPNQQQQQQMHVQQQQQPQMTHQQQQQQQLPHQHQHQQLQQQQQQQESSSPLQAVLSPPQQQVGSPSMGLQQASPQQMSQRTPMSPQLSSGAIHPPMSAGNQEANGPASPQLSSQTMGSVSSMTNSPMDVQGVNKSS
ncbi:protein PHYTOCHROME-DEPENDENT LATE-FLOWERING-like [Bidens hawaiensis]|uniref:protein PHYTOCHROME-DEPENDENT LATE-FLOWERING-like n=1 Tax=Bidens hawaiensis TaxID=980011 RepID=UPI004049084F